MLAYPLILVLPIDVHVVLKQGSRMLSQELENFCSLQINREKWRSSKNPAVWIRKKVPRVESLPSTMEPEKILDIVSDKDSLAFNCVFELLGICMSPRVQAGVFDVGEMESVGVVQA